MSEPAAPLLLRTGTMRAVAHSRLADLGLRRYYGYGAEQGEREHVAELEARAYADGRREAGLSLPSVRKQVQPAYARPRAEVEAYERGRAQSALPASEWREYSEYG